MKHAAYPKVCIEHISPSKKEPHQRGNYGQEEDRQEEDKQEKTGQKEADSQKNHTDHEVGTVRQRVTDNATSCPAGF